MNSHETLWALKPYLPINLFINKTQKDVHKTPLVDNSIGIIVNKIITMYGVR